MRFIISILFVLSLVPLDAQIVTVAIPEKDSVEVGELFKITYRVNIPYVNAVQSLSMISLDSMVNLNEMYKDSTAALQYADFEIQDYGTWPVNQLEYKPAVGDWKSRNGKFSINIPIIGRIWDYGVFELPGLHVDIDTNSRVQLLETIDSRIFVLPPSDYVHQDTTVAIAGIKTIIEEPTTWQDYLWILYSVLILGLCYLAYYLWQRMKKKETVPVVEEKIIIRSAHDIALEKLDRLKAEKIWETGDIKEYQSELTFVAREYLENRYKIPALELTTDEILHKLKAVEFPDVHERDLKEILTIADLVKFAKAKPTGSIHEEFLVKTYDLVNHTKRERSLDEDE